MSSVRYFVTEKDEAAKNWEMVERYKALRSSLTRLEDELRSYSISWTILGQKTGEGERSNYYRITEKGIEVLRPDLHKTTSPDEPHFRTEVTLSVEHFNLEKISALLTNISNTRQEGENLRRQLGKLGLSL